MTLPTLTQEQMDANDAFWMEHFMELHPDCAECRRMRCEEHTDADKLCHGEVKCLCVL